MELLRDRERLLALYRDHLAELDRRYAPVLAEHGVAALLIHSGSLKKRTEFDDQYWPLRATPQLQHFLPLAEPDCALLVRPGQRPQLYWLNVTSFWERPGPLESDHWLGEFDITRVNSVEEVKAELPPGLRLAYVGEDRSRGDLWGVPAELQNPPELLRALDRLRVRKTPYEVQCIAEANRRAALGHEAVRARFVAGEDSELDLHLAFLAATAQDDAETPYKNILALGRNAATLHHVSYVKRAERLPAQSLLVDAGATCLGYCSDITRTWAKGAGPAYSAFVGLVEQTEAMQKALCAQIRVGEKYEELHDEAHRQVARILREIGVSRLSDEEAGAAGVSRAFFPHGLGHSLGLVCHDVGCALARPRVENPYLRNTSTIVEQQVFTVEPGIYFIDGLLAPLREGPHAGAIDWRLVDELAQLGGVRIEDDLVVTGGAAVTRNLTRELLPVGGSGA